MVKRIRFNDEWCWAVNPAYALSGKTVSWWLYDIFKADMDRFLTLSAKNRYMGLIAANAERK